MAAHVFGFLREGFLTSRWYERIQATKRTWIRKGGISFKLVISKWRGIRSGKLLSECKQLQRQPYQLEEVLQSLWKRHGEVIRRGYFPWTFQMHHELHKRPRGRNKAESGRDERIPAHVLDQDILAWNELQENHRIHDWEFHRHCKLSPHIG